MAKLYASLFWLTLLFAAAMSFATLAVYDDQWWPGVVAGGFLVVFAGLGGVLVPGVTRSLSGGRLRTARAALQLFGSLCGLQFFTMALITWILGKRVVGPNNAYLTLGLLLFLGLIGIGIQGVLAMVGYFVYVRNEAIVAPTRQAERERWAASDHGMPEEQGSLAGHDAPMPLA